MLRLFDPTIARGGCDMDKSYKIGRFVCNRCGANPWIEVKYDLTRCEYCQVPFLIKYHVDSVVSVGIEEINKLKELELFYDIPDISQCSDKYKMTYFFCNNCKKGYFYDPSEGIILCNNCFMVYNTDEVISDEDKKYAVEIKKLKAKDKTTSASSSVRNIKSAQRIEKQSTVSVPKSEDDKSKGLFSKLFKK